MKTKRRATGIEISHWKTGEADDFQALYPEGSDHIDQAFPEAGETEMIEEYETIIRNRPTRRCNKV